MKFILTPELGRLAKWLRILGFDADNFTKANFSSLLIRALRDKRVILTRNAHLANKAQATKVLRIKDDEVNRQLKQVLQELCLKPDKRRMFSRCIICNLKLEKIAKKQAKEKVPEYVFNTQDEFLICPSCGRIYWPGTHWGNVAKILEGITK